MLWIDRGRLAAQPGGRSGALVKTALTAAALGTTAASGVLGAKVGASSPVPSATATEPSAATPPDTAAAQKGLKPLQWVNPALTGALIVLTAQQGEQQRTASVLRGVLGQGLTAVKGAVAKAAA
jgi:hypothetical protein